MRKILFVSLMVVVANPAFAAPEMLAVRTVTVTGVAEHKVVPDEAHITVNLNAMDKKIAVAKATHDAKLSKLMGIVKDAGIDEKKVSTQSSSTQPVYHYDNDGKGKNVRTFDGYRVQTNIDITVSDTKKLGGLMEAISSAGLEEGADSEWGNLMSVNYTISNPMKLREEMLVEAMDNAKEKAAKLAEAAGAVIGSVYQISEGDTPRFAPMPMAMQAPRGYSDAAARIAPPAGEQQLESTVNVTYELK